MAHELRFLSIPSHWSTCDRCAREGECVKVARAKDGRLGACDLCAACFQGGGYDFVRVRRHHFAILWDECLFVINVIRRFRGVFGA